MRELIGFLSDIVSLFHEFLIFMFDVLGLDLNDKQMHFWVIGVIGIIMFFFVHIAFSYLSRWSITVLSLIYTLTVILVLVFAIEIQQGITGSGNMNFQDAVMGVWGFLALFAVFIGIKLLVKFIQHLWNRSKKGDQHD